MEHLLQQLEECVQQQDDDDGENIDRGMTVLAQVKKMMVLSPPTTSAKRSVLASALEWGALLTVLGGDFAAFERTVNQLRPLYSTITTPPPPAGAGAAGAVVSPRKHHIQGLLLMHLLVENRLSEFHSELELLTDQEASDPYISFPVAMERQLMVGIYDEVLAMQVPHPSYQIFMDELVQTVRDSIASCIEVSYQLLTLEQAAALMKFDSAADLKLYMSEFRDDWILEENNLHFQPAATSSAQDIPSMQWIQQALTYATEMERIV